MTGVAAIDAWLPQTQCRRCGYPDCLAYARAIRDGEADINRCPPGGEATLNGLAALLDRAPTPLDPSLEPFDGFRTARIDEWECIGCAKCIEACPVDAIVGSGKRMHAVIGALCTGCELCLPPCPVDCIELVARARPARAKSRRRWPDFPRASVERFRAARARARKRLARREYARVAARRPRPDEERMRDRVHAAVARARAAARARTTAPTPADAASDGT